MKKKIAGIGIMMLLLTGCNDIDKNQTSETEKYYLITAKAQSGKVESFPENKCAITMRGENSYASVSKEMNETEENIIKGIRGENEKKDISCIDNFTQEQIEVLTQNAEISYIEYIGTKNPLGSKN